MLCAALTLSSVALPAAPSARQPEPVGRQQGAASPSRPRPTEHAPLPSQIEQFWLVPPAGWTPGRSDVISAEVQNALVNNKDVKKALQDANAKCNKLSGW